MSSMVFVSRSKEALGKRWLILSLSVFLLVFPVDPSEAANDQGSVNYLESFKSRMLDAAIAVSYTHLTLPTKRIV